jgi:ketosteroid isomerase-like protein
MVILLMTMHSKEGDHRQMTTETHKNQAFIEKMNSALNQHDLEAFLDCFDSGYQSEQPVHPDRRFTGKEQVQKNWSGIFRSIPDFRAELVRVAFADNVIWAEWDWQGTRPDETPFQMRGVTIMELRNGRITWGRLYMEPVETNGAGIDSSVNTLTRDKQTKES